MKSVIKLLSKTIFFSIIGIYASNAQNLPAIKTIKGPEAAAIDKAIDIPVSLYTGQTNINIPLYEINIKGVSIPISLVYNGGGGIKVDEEATSVGLGWMLNYGGSISRKLKGKPDERGFFEKQQLAEFFALPSFNQAPYQQQNTEFLRYVKNPNYWDNDLEPDEFNYNAVGYSGKFMYKQSAAKFIVFPKEDVAVSYSRASSPNTKKIEYWDLLLPDGTKYTFGADGISRSETILFDPMGDVMLPVENMWSVKRITNTYGESIDYIYTPVNYTSFSRSTNEAYSERTGPEPLSGRTQTSMTEPIIQFMASGSRQAYKRHTGGRC